ncbi:MAG TPA: hypothetical protein VGH20_18130 [Myxococcales bacterium]|jgi:hypothetical protein
MRSLFAVCLGLSFVGCATGGSQSTSLKNKSGTPTLASNAGGPNAKGKYVCEFEEDTGSHLRNKVCRYVDSDTEARMHIQDEVRNLDRAGANTANMLGGGH